MIGKNSCDHTLSANRINRLCLLLHRSRYVGTYNPNLHTCSKTENSNICTRIEDHTLDWRWSGPRSLQLSRRCLRHVAHEIIQFDFGFRTNVWQLCIYLVHPRLQSLGFRRYIADLDTVVAGFAVTASFLAVAPAGRTAAPRAAYGVVVHTPSAAL